MHSNNLIKMLFKIFFKRYWNKKSHKEGNLCKPHTCYNANTYTNNKSCERQYQCIWSYRFSVNKHFISKE